MHTKVTALGYDRTASKRAINVNVVLDVFNLATVPAARLGRTVATLADEDSCARLVRAMDELLSQA